RTQLPHGKPVSAHRLEPARIDTVLTCQQVEVRAEPRPLAQPTADPQVGVIALGEDPPVSAGHHPELDPRSLLVGGTAERRPGAVPLERAAAHDPLVEPGRAGADPVRPAGADEERRVPPGPPPPPGDSFAADLQLAHCGSVAELGSGGHRLLREVEVESPPL